MTQSKEGRELDFSLPFWGTEYLSFFTFIYPQGRSWTGIHKGPSEL